jgi:hypothetical protein
MIVTSWVRRNIVILVGFGQLLVCVLHACSRTFRLTKTQNVALPAPPPHPWRFVALHIHFFVQ